MTVLNTKYDWITQINRFLLNIFHFFFILRKEEEK